MHEGKRTRVHMARGRGHGSRCASACAGFSSGELAPLTAKSIKQCGVFIISTACGCVGMSGSVLFLLKRNRRTICAGFSSFDGRAGFPLGKMRGFPHILIRCGVFIRY